MPLILNQLQFDFVALPVLTCACEGRQPVFETATDLFKGEVNHGYR